LNRCYGKSLTQRSDNCPFALLFWLSAAPLCYGRCTAVSAYPVQLYVMNIRTKRVHWVTV